MKHCTFIVFTSMIKKNWNVNSLAIYHRGQNQQNNDTKEDHLSIACSIQI